MSNTAPQPDSRPLESKDQPEEFPPLSPNHALFEFRGQNFLIESGEASITVFLQSTTLAHYPEVRGSWLKAVEALNFGTPKLKTASPALQTEAASFFIELRHGNRALAFKKYASLVQAQDNEETFWKGVTDTLANRHKPDNRESSLAFRLLGLWLHGCFWAMSNEHRAQVLTYCYGTPISSPAGNPVAVLKKTIQRLKLKSYSSFPQTYSEPPILATVYHQAGQDPQQYLCEIFLR
jgi:hypothetical protein